MKIKKFKSEMLCAKRNPYNAWKKIIPKISKGYIEVHNFLNGTQCMRSRNKHFVQYNKNEKNASLYFSVKQILKYCVVQQ